MVSELGEEEDGIFVGGLLVLGEAELDDLLQAGHGGVLDDRVFGNDEGEEDGYELFDALGRFDIDDLGVDEVDAALDELELIGLGGLVLEEVQGMEDRMIVVLRYNWKRVLP